MTLSSAPLEDRRIAVVYDCLYPWTVGGEESWLRTLSEGLAAAGARVTYVTRRQWSDEPDIPGVEVVAVSRSSELYDEAGGRRVVPTLRFGVDVSWYLLRHRRDFDAVFVASFPHVAVLAARVALLGSRTKLVINWVELWSREFWLEYAGAVMGRVGRLTERLCVAATPSAIANSPSVKRRLEQSGYRRRVDALPGLLSAASVDPREPSETPYVLFGGRHTRDKGVDLLPGIFVRIHAERPDVTFVVTGEGPMTAPLKSALAKGGLGPITRFAGFVGEDELDELVGAASCVVLPSRREGFGIMAGSVSRFGTPVVVGQYPENAATDLVDIGRNGFVADPPSPSSFAEAAVAAIDAGATLRSSSAAWYRDQVSRRSVAHSVDFVVRRLVELTRS